MLRRILFFVVVTAGAVLAQSGSDACCRCEGGDRPRESRAACLTAKEMRNQLDHFEGLQPSGLGHGLNLNGTVVLDIRFDAEGKVVCSRARSGHPIAISAAMHAIPKWSFKPVRSNGTTRGGCGPITIKYHLRDQGSSSEVQ